MELKIRGITKTWVMNIFAVVVVVVLAFEIVIGFVIQNYYYSAVTNQLTELVRTYESASVFTDDADFETNARNLTEKFENKNIAEMQVYDAGNRVIISTTGFLPQGTSISPDYEAALAAYEKKEPKPKPYIGRADGRERVMAATVILSGNSAGRIGAVRFVISMRDVDSHIRNNVLVIILIGLGLVAFVFASGMYFIQSILRPIQAVNSTARRIASGDFESRIEVRKADEIGELCDTINYMAAELAASETIKNDFISSVSHELRTPLTAIKGWGETVSSALGNDTVLVEKGVDIIIRESERLSGLVEELLDFSRMQSGRFSFTMKRIDILAELEEAVYMYGEPARRASVTLKYEAPELVGPVNGDAARLKQVFINVVDNAIKYSRQEGAVLVKATEEDGCIRVTVQDNGVGIPAADVEHVKEKFYKANKTVRGSGIGLAVADEIIKQHNGLLLLESREGEGTTVTIVLPTEQLSARSSSEPEPIINQEADLPTDEPAADKPVEFEHE